MAGMLESWAASSNFGRNAKALSTELRLVKATLEEAANKEMSWLEKLDIEERLGKLRDSMHNADDLLDKLDYFRIQDKEHNTYEAADKHGKGCFCNLALNARHTAKVSCCRWLRAKRRQRPRGDSSSSPHTNQEVSGCMPKLGKLLPCSSSSPPHPHVPGQDHVNAQEKPTLEFNRVNFSQNMKDVEQKLQLMRTEVNEILQRHAPGIVPAQSHLITKSRIDEQLYGRDHVMNSIIHDITKGQYSDKGITVLPVVGPGGVGKTTLIQHIYRNQQVQNHFPVRIWICVSFSFNLDKVLEQIKTCTPAVEKEKIGSTTEDLIEQRLKSKRFLLVLDDIWQISNMDDWEKLLLILGQSQEKGCMILVTTRCPLIAERVNTADHPKVLDGLEPQEFRKLFLAFVFDDEQCPRDKKILLETGDKIMGKLKGSPLAVKTVARLLRKDLSLGHWERVLNSRQWEEHTGDNEIMLALKISYDFLPFYLQQCFAYSGLFPKDFHSSSSQLINLWIGLDILKPVGRNKTFEDIGLSHLNDLVTQGFFREEETNGCPCYVMHDLLHDLASSISSHENLTLHCSNVGSVDIPPSIRHLSIIIDDDNAVSSENFKIELRKLEIRFNVQNLQTLMLFGEMDESLANIFGYLFRDANALRVLHLHEMSYPVESILHNLSTLVHLRYLFLRTKVRGLMHRFSVSFKHLKFLQVLDLDGCDDLGNSAMVDICLMIKLKYLSLKKTQVTTLPPRIGELQNLETLDVSQTQMKDLPKEVLELPRLTHLHFGQSGCFGVKLPVGIDQLESVQVMGTVDSRECSESAMKEISELPELRELEVVMYDGSDDMEQNDNLLSFIGKCSNLKSLTIYGDSNLRDKPLPESPPESPDFPKLEKLKVAGRFVKVPCWIAQLRTLPLLVIRVCKLEVNDLVIIGRLPYLSVLELALVALPRKEVTITSSAGFARLEVFCFDCRVPWVNFQEKAMPNLEQLQLKLYSGPADKVPSGIMLLERLNNVTLLYSSQYAGSVGVRETVNVATRDATSHANLIELSINGDREIFLPNISADRVVPGTEFDTSVNTGAEIEEVPASK